MKRFLLLLPLLFTLYSCGDKASEASNAPQKDFLDSLYRPGNYRAMLDSLTTFKNLNKEEIADLKGYMQQNADYMDATWRYRDIHESAQAMHAVKKAPIAMTVTGLTPRSDRKIVEFRFDLDFKNQSSETLRRFYAQLVWRDAEGKELDRSPRFAVDKVLEPGAEIKKQRLQYAYYRPTGNEMNQPKNERQRTKVDAMMSLAKKFDAGNYELEVQELMLGNGMTVAEYYRLHPNQRKTVEPREEKKPIALLKWAERNKDWIKQLKSSVSVYYLETTPVLTTKFEATHGPYLLFDRIDKFNGFFKGQMKIPGSKINQGAKGKMVLHQKIDFWKWPMEIRIYQRS